MRCLIEMGYPSSGGFNPHDLAHKHAVFPFMQVLGLFFGQTLGQHFTNGERNGLCANSESTYHFFIAFCYIYIESIRRPTDHPENLQTHV